MTPAIDPGNGNKKSNQGQFNKDQKEEARNFSEQENLRDAKTIFMYNIIKKMNPNVNVVTELINQDNISYMLNDPLLYYLQSKYLYD